MLKFLLNLFILVKILIKIECNNNRQYEYDKNGYVIFCLCMGRFGNQADHFLGAMSFAKQINRTLVVPPFRTYKNVPYKEWFKLEKLDEFHRVISAEDFMKQIAPKYWPSGERIGFCWHPDKDYLCNMKDGYPMNNFWTEIGVDKFDKSINFNIDIFDYEKWITEYPSDKYPVIALRGAPATYPVNSKHRENQKYMIWSDEIRIQVEDYIRITFGEEKFIGIHLRNGIDWSNACERCDGLNTYMSSPQCLENTNKKVTNELCFPSKETVLKNLEILLIDKLNKTIRNIYIATDHDPMIIDIKSYFNGLIDNLKLVHYDPWLPLIDLAILSESDYFIGNCVSSFTSFVKRQRDIHNKTSFFWSFF